MKKLMAIVVVVIMCFAIAGCGGAPSNQKVEVAATAAPAAPTAIAEKEEDWTWLTDNIYDIITEHYNYGKVFIEDGDLVVMFGNYGTYDDLAPYVNAPAVKKQWNVDVRPALDKSAVALCKVAEDADFPGSVHYVLVDETYTHIMYWNIDGITVLDIFNN